MMGNYLVDAINSALWRAVYLRFGAMSWQSGAVPFAADFLREWREVSTATSKAV